MAFDSDNDGKISSRRLDLSGVSAEILEIMKPLLYELESLNE